MIQEMEDTLVEVRSAAVKNHLREEGNRSAAGAAGRAPKPIGRQKAEFAIAKGRDDLAKGALLAKRKLAESAKHAARRAEGRRGSAGPP